MIKKYLQFMNESKKEKPGTIYKFGCVMIELNILNWDELTGMIDPEDIYLPEDPSKGLESNPHITVLFGLEKVVTTEQVKDVFDNYNEPIHLEVDGIGMFEGQDYDVVKLNVKPDGHLQHLHDELSKLPHTDSFPDYNPHITLAFVKKGAGQKYIRPDYKYTIKHIGKIKYSTPTGEKIYFDYEIN